MDGEKNLLMKERSHSNVKFVTWVLHEKTCSFITWKKKAIQMWILPLEFSYDSKENFCRAAQSDLLNR